MPKGRVILNVKPLHAIIVLWANGLCQCLRSFNSVCTAGLMLTLQTTAQQPCTIQLESCPVCGCIPALKLVAAGVQVSDT